jgi:hypothetical protein
VQTALIGQPHHRHHTGAGTRFGSSNEAVTAVVLCDDRS